MQLRLAALVLHRKRGFAVRVGAEFDQVGHASQPKPPAGQRQRRDTTDAAALAVTGFVRDLVHHAPLGGKTVLFPHSLDMDESRLTHAIDGVLERRDRYRIVEVLRHQPS
jgi:hypothetical protein